jgi:hypothetical protein
MRFPYSRIIDLADTAGIRAFSAREVIGTTIALGAVPI